MTAPGIARAAPLALATLALVGADLRAQSFRTITASRVPTGERELAVNVEFAVGRFQLRPHPGHALYSVELVYDEDRFTPRTRYDAAERKLDVAVTTRGRGDIQYKGGTRQRLDLALSPAVVTRLDLKFGAVEADVDVGGLSLAEAVIRTGASQSRVYFSRPNRTQCRELSFEVGAAQFTAAQLGNARCEQVRFKGAAGDITLDFTGLWTAGAQTAAEVKLGFGALTLRLPDSVGVAVTLDRFLASFDDRGFTKRGSTYYSDGYDAASARLHIDIGAAVGDIRVVWAR